MIFVSFDAYFFLIFFCASMSRKQATVDVAAGESDLRLIERAMAIRRMLTEIAPNKLPPLYSKAWYLLNAHEFNRVTRQGAFVRDGFKLRGLTDTLDTIFHSRKLNVHTDGNRTGGSERGRRVDNQLTSLIDRGALPSEPLDGFTVNVLRALDKKGLVPFMTQANVGSVELGVGTALDILCINIAAPVNNNVESIQLKTFGPRNHHKAVGTFHSIFHPSQVIQNTQDTLIQRALMQVMCEFAITQYGHNEPLHSARLLVVTSRSIDKPIDTVAKWYDMPGHHLHVAEIFRRSCQSLKTTNDMVLQHKLADEHGRQNWRKNHLK